MNAQDFYRDALGLPLRHLFRRTGFATKDHVRWRRMGTVVQMIRIAKVAPKDQEHGRLTFAVALSFDAICNPPGVPDPAREAYPHAHFFWRSLCHMVEGMPMFWNFGPETDPEELRRDVIALLEQGIAALDAIDSPAAFVDHWWSRGMASLELVAMLLYQLGRYEEALDALRRAERFFLGEDRRVDRVIARLGLTELGRMQGDHRRARR
jgi:hypothetical protein